MALNKTQLKDQIKQIMPSDGITISITGAGTDQCLVEGLYTLNYSTGVFEAIYNSGILPGATFTGTVRVRRMPQVWVVRNNSASWLLQPITHFSEPSSTSTDGNTRFYINFLVNFEASTVPAMGVLNPETDRVYARIVPGQADSYHSDVLKYIIQKAGFSVDTTSFNLAKTDLASEVMFSIPETGGGEPGTYESYIANILKSTFGYLFINEDESIGYAIFKEPSSTNEITKTEIIDETFEAVINYDDLANQIQFQNTDATYREIADFNNVFVENQDRGYLDSAIIYETFTHVLYDITDRTSEILNFKSKPQITYNLEVKGKLLDAKIGDDILLKTDGLIGDKTEVAVKIISIDNGVGSTRISAIDLEDL
jgi:hypothetical protein